MRAEVNSLDCLPSMRVIPAIAGKRIGKEEIDFKSDSDEKGQRRRSREGNRRRTEHRYEVTTASSSANGKSSFSASYSVSGGSSGDDFVSKTDTTDNSRIHRKTDLTESFGSMETGDDYAATSTDFDNVSGHCSVNSGNNVAPSQSRPLSNSARSFVPYGTATDASSGEFSTHSQPLAGALPPTRSSSRAPPPSEERYGTQRARTLTRGSSSSTVRHAAAASFSTCSTLSCVDRDDPEIGSIQRRGTRLSELAEVQHEAV